MSETNDPKGLIRESYRMEGIDASQCRSIFLDWAISVPMGQDPATWITALLDEYGTENPDHPMTKVLRDALMPPAQTGRRGGASARRRGNSA